MTKMQHILPFTPCPTIRNVAARGACLTLLCDPAIFLSSKGSAGSLMVELFNYRIRIRGATDGPWWKTEAGRCQIAGPDPVFGGAVVNCGILE